MNSSIQKAIILFVLVLAISVFLQATPASAVFIDFETYPGGTSTSHFDSVDTQYFSWGISSISSLEYISATDTFEVVPAIIRQDPLTNPYPSGIRALAPWPGDGTYYGPAQAPIEFYFTTPLNYFSIIAMDVGWNGLIVDAYASDSSLISSFTIDGTGREHFGVPGGNGQDFIEFTDSGISMVKFSQIHDAQWDVANGLGTEGYLLDNINFTVVPEPVSAVLFITGGLLFAARCYRRRKSDSK